MMAPLRSKMNTHAFDQLTGNIFLCHFTESTTHLLSSSFVMCENTLDKKADVLFQYFLLNRVDRLMTPLIHNVDNSQPVCLYPS
jgi:hypothetical protein